MGGVIRVVAPEISGLQNSIYWIACLSAMSFVMRLAMQVAVVQLAVVPSDMQYYLVFLFGIAFPGPLLFCSGEEGACRWWKRRARMVGNHSNHSSPPSSRYVCMRVRDHDFHEYIFAMIFSLQH